MLLGLLWVSVYITFRCECVFSDATHLEGHARRDAQSDGSAASAAQFLSNFAMANWPETRIESNEIK